MGRYKGKSISMERKEPMQMDNHAFVPEGNEAVRGHGCPSRAFRMGQGHGSRPIYFVEISEGWCPHLRDIILCCA